MITGRVFNGIGGSVPLGIGAAVICDLFTQGERGLFMGIYTVSVSNGPHVAPIAGGYIAERLGWRVSKLTGKRVDSVTCLPRGVSPSLSEVLCY